jgi:hypothetical protein
VGAEFSDDLLRFKMQSAQWLVTVTKIHLNGKVIFRALPPDLSGGIGVQTYTDQPKRK